MQCGVKSIQGDIVSTVTKAALVAIVDMIPLDTKVYIIPTVV